jgi:glutathionyl-hydroquinone reductase
MLFRSLKGLKDVISVSFTQPFMGDTGWTLAEGADPVQGKRFLYEVYLAADPNFTGRVSVPVLWDRLTSSIVSNESEDIARCFDKAFDAFATRHLRKGVRSAHSMPPMLTGAVGLRAPGYNSACRTERS